MLKTVLKFLGTEITKPNLNLVSNFTPLGLWQLKMPFGDGRLYIKIFRLKMKKLSEFLILSSRLFHSVTFDRKHKFLKKVCLTLNWGMLPMFLVLSVLPMVGILLNIYFGGLLLVSFLYHRCCCKNSKPNYW